MKTDTLCYFLGANSPSGFFSFFDYLIDLPSASRVCILKGGPGTGKSSFMKRIAAAAARNGIGAEYVYCSSDPRSFDALVIPSLGFAVVDGTAPHVVEPKYPGAVEEIVNLGSFWDRSALTPHRDQIISLSTQISERYARAYRYIGAASFLLRDCAGLLAPALRAEKLDRYAARFADRYLPVQASEARETKRFLSAITPEGVVSFSDPLARACETVIVVEDSLCVAPLLMQKLRDLALARGQDVVSHYCPMAPGVHIDHLYFPSAGVCVLSSGDFHPYDGAFTRRINTRRFADAELCDGCKARVRFNRKCARALLDSATSALAETKGLHDDLETPFIAAMDFDAVGACADRLIAELFG